MTPQERIERSSLVALNKAGGVLVTINPRNISVWAQIDRVNKPATKVDSDIVIQGDVGLTVYIQKRLLNIAPRAGELIEEANGDTHRIGLVKDLGQRYQVFCESTPL